MNLKWNLLQNTFFSFICQKIFFSGKLLYFMIMFTKRNVGARIAMPIKGNVHLLFRNVQTHDSTVFR